MSDVNGGRRQNQWACARSLKRNGTKSVEIEVEVRVKASPTRASARVLPFAPLLPCVDLDAACTLALASPISLPILTIKLSTQSCHQLVHLHRDANQSQARDVAMLMRPLLQPTRVVEASPSQTRRIRRMETSRPREAEVVCLVPSRLIRGQ